MFRVKLKPIQNGNVHLHARAFKMHAFEHDDSELEAEAQRWRSGDAKKEKGKRTDEESEMPRRKRGNSKKWKRTRKVAILEAQ